MSEANVINRLIEAFRCLPGVGPKSAQRMVYHLLERDRDGAKILANTLSEAVDKVGHCSTCRNLSEDAVCDICANPRRDESVLCVVESPADIHAIEQAAGYRGRYFVLMGHLSPLDSIGPEELGLDMLAKYLESGEIKEVILATGSSVEGEATAHYVSEMARSRQIRVTRIAHGVPLGSDLEYVDRGTLSHAFNGRQEI